MRYSLMHTYSRTKRINLLMKKFYISITFRVIHTFIQIKYSMKLKSISEISSVNNTKVDHILSLLYFFESDLKLLSEDF